MSLQQVHVRINDADTEKPTPCRVRFTDAAGKYYAPLGRLTEFATAPNVDVGGNVLVDSKKYAYIDGTFEILLPPGKINIEVRKGPEYTPLIVEQELQAGKLSMRLTIERWINLREHGWYSGDARAHFLTPHAALLEAMAEDLAIVNLLATQYRVSGAEKVAENGSSGSWAIANLLAFSGQKPALEAPGHMVVVNTLNWHPWLGRLGLLNCHRVVQPLRFGAPGHDDWTLADWCDQCHRKAGLVVWSGMEKGLSEGVADAILGKIDAMEVDSSIWDEFPDASLWGCLADCGIDLPYVGASGKMSNAEVLGGVRTYARMEPDQPLSYAGWIEAVRAGRSFITRGPLLYLTVNGHDPSTVIDVPATGTDIEVVVQAMSVSPFHRVELQYPGGEINALAEGSPPVAKISGRVQLESSGWLMAQVWPAEGYDQPELAMISPIRLRVAGHPLGPPSPEHVRMLQQHLASMAERLQKEGRFANDAQRQRLDGVFEQAVRRLEQISSPS